MELTNKTTLLSLLKKHNIFLKKSLGQNFLINPHVLKKIVDQLDITNKDTILEIGCGVGTLTLELAKRAKEVIGIEVDKRFKPILEEILKDYNVKLIFEDVLKLDLRNIITQPYKLTGNLPYYISGSFLGEYLKKGPYAQIMLLMLQKEMFERITSKPGSKKYSPLSILLNLNYKYELITKVSPDSFFPPPEVESVVIKLTYSPTSYDILDKDLFYKILRISFAQRRKYLINNLQRNLPQIKWEVLFKDLNIDLKARAEEIPPEIFIELANRVKNYEY
jgi:16S rRNA (adenine1518-N6/adenine1519-N6)-dimethyltransferase